MKVDKEELYTYIIVRDLKPESVLALRFMLPISSTVHLTKTRFRLGVEQVWL